MARRKVKLSYITKKSARKATFKKRKWGLTKKLCELTTLCDVRACCIIYGAYGPQPEIWPSPATAHEILADFGNMPHLDQRKKMLNQEALITQRTVKANDECRKTCCENHKRQVTRHMFQGLASGQVPPKLGLIDLHDLQWVIDNYRREIYKQLKDKQANGTQSSGIFGTHTQQMPMAPPLGAPIGSVENMYKQSWFQENMHNTSKDAGIAENGDEVMQSNYEDKNFN